MKLIKVKPELLAPAGSFESLIAALKAGADSVYFGVEQLNMRARSANNFTLDDLKEIVRICNEKNIKTYLTLNTILYDHDISLMKKIVDKAKQTGVTAIIASDPAVLSHAKNIGAKVHISTQANVSNIETLMFYSAFADLMVLSRELSLMQVKEISKLIKKKKISGPSGNLVKLEVFAHGALCMAVSGKCYMSLHSHFASANRGACIQNCRREYIVTDKQEGIEFEIDNEYIMSAKDLCTIEFLDKIIDAGASVLKIEGRGRSADYVFTVVQCYREAIDSISEGSYTKEKVEDWKQRLSTVFNRGFWDGYYLGRKMGEWSDSEGSKATRKKSYVGKGMKYFDRVGIGEFKLEAGELSMGDEVLITGPTTGVIQTKISSLRIDGVDALKAIKGDLISFPVPETVRGADKLFKITEA
jgi:U32 family peptidase